MAKQKQEQEDRERKAFATFTEYDKNPRKISQQQQAQLEQSLLELGDLGGIVVNVRTGQTIGGNQRSKVLTQQAGAEIVILERHKEPTPTGTVAQGYVELPSGERFSYREVTWDAETEARANVVANKLGGEWDMPKLLAEFPLEDLQQYGFSLDELKLDSVKTGLPGKYEGKNTGALAKQFIIPPFTVLNTNGGDWLERRKTWGAFMEERGQTREGKLGGDTFMRSINNGVSILDPVLCEVLLHWFCPDGGQVFDPFAGDLSFGFVAAYKGHSFQGTELRQEQVNANTLRTQQAGVEGAKWICDDARNLAEHIGKASQDFIFTCPPYADLEVYSEDPRDLSTMGHEEFLAVYQQVLGSLYSRLRPNRFAAVVIGEVIGEDGGYLGLVPSTIRAMIGSGFMYWNEAILVNTAGTLPLRVGKQMNASKKLGKQHQNVLVFYKGDPKAIRTEFPELYTPGEAVE